MKKLLFLGLFFLLILRTPVFADVKFFSEEGKFGAKDEQGNVVVEAKYHKLIRLGDKTLLAQKKNKFGIIDFCGKEIVPIKYRQAERVLGEYAKLGNYGKYGLYDKNGTLVIPHEYDSIDLLFGGMLLTYKNYKYGVIDFSGRVILDNLFDEIYMPKSNIMRLQYQGNWYEIEQVTADTLTLPVDVKTVTTSSDFKVTNLMVNTGVMSGYSVLTFSDYIIKILSSISPAHERTIDQLMLSQGADTVNILLKFSWIPKYPFAFARNYYHNMRNPNSGILSGARANLKKKIRE